MSMPPLQPRPERRTAPRTVTPLSVPALDGHEWLTFPLNQEQLDALVHMALKEDEAFHDLTTSSVVRSDRRARATLVARGAGILAGVPIALEAFRILDPKVSIRVDVDDGMRVSRGVPVFFVNGHARAILSAERVALNFMQHLSGIATVTAKFVEAVRGTTARIFDTRKTLPGWRTLEKYAVRAGGGCNHRMDLASGVLIKDNHLAACDGRIEQAIKRARDLAPPDVKIEVECESVEQVERALDAGADLILLDNMSVELLATCVAIARGRAITEASGGITLDTVRAIAETGVDRISVGKLTHSAPALDLALDFQATP
jgi:nicotinate-nucleotide pyrophosphorylase (carboxylating)